MVTLVILLPIATSQLPAKGAATEFPAAFQRARAELLAGNYLTAVEIVRPFALSRSDVVLDEGAFQIWDQMQAMISGQPSVLMADKDDAIDPQAASLVEAASQRDAIEAIVERARRTRVVMLNENHKTPCQRTFAIKVAEALRPLGFDTLALEGLATVPSSRVADLKNRGYPVLGDGFYVRDPAFGFLIRRSLALGYAPMAYEADRPLANQTDLFAARERGQAQKILSHLRAYPRSKILVFGGGGHLAERPLADGSKMMGQWFGELSGLDPLTIDQNQLQPTTALYKQVIKLGARRDVMLFDGAAPLILGRMAGRVDLQVLPMMPGSEAGRPRCLKSGDRRLVNMRIPRALEDQALVQAYGVREVDDAVPLDQFVLKPGQTKVSLLVPRGSVRFVIRTR